MPPRLGIELRDMQSRRTFLETLLCAYGAASGHPSRSLSPSAYQLPHFVDIAAKAGLTAKTVIGRETKKPFILESTGGGVALFDYDNDGWLDIFLVNGSRFEGFPSGQEPTNHLYRNNRDGTFTDVTREAGLIFHGCLREGGDSQRRLGLRVHAARSRLRQRRMARYLCGV